MKGNAALLAHLSLPHILTLQRRVQARIGTGLEIFTTIIGIRGSQWAEYPLVLVEAGGGRVRPHTLLLVRDRDQRGLVLARLKGPAFRRRG